MTTAKILHDQADELSSRRMAALTQKDELLLSIEENAAYAAYYHQAAVEALDADDIKTCRDTAGMNIRQHALQSIRSGMPAQITVQATAPGVQFLADDAEFIEFSDLNYNPEIGYYRLSVFPDQPRECTNENPETIHSHGDDPDEEQMYVWMDGDGFPHLLGTAAQAADLYAALGAFLTRGELDPEPVDEYDPAWGQNYDIADAVREAIAYGYADAGDEARMADTIRAAARAGRIRKARQVNGAWMLPKLTFRGWLVKSRDEKRGRPRKGDGA